MELYNIPQDIPTMFIDAKSFPAGVLDAWNALHEKVPNDKGRRFFGVSWEDQNHVIQYKAAAEQLIAGESKSKGLGSFVIPKGVYASEVIKDFQNNMSAFGTTFTQLLRDPRLDPNGFCLEIYTDSPDTICLVKLEDAKAK